MAKYINLIEKTGNNTYTDTYIKQNLPREILFTLSASNWSSGTVPSQTVTVNGVTANTAGIIGVAMTATQEEWRAAQCGQLRIVLQGTNSIRIAAYGVKPTIDIPCVLTCSSNMKLYRSSGIESSDTVVGS